MAILYKLKFLSFLLILTAITLFINQVQTTPTQYYSYVNVSKRQSGFNKISKFTSNLKQNWLNLNHELFTDNFHYSNNDNLGYSAEQNDFNKKVKNTFGKLNFEIKKFFQFLLE